MSRRPTIRDVARRAGTSVASISRYMNLADGVSEGLRTRIKDAVHELKYVPNANARALITAVSSSVGIAILRVRDYDTASFALQLAAELNKRGRNVTLLVEPNSADRSMQLERFALANLRTIILAEAELAPGSVPVGWGSPVMCVFVRDTVAAKNDSKTEDLIDFALGPLAGAASYIGRPNGELGGTTGRCDRDKNSRIVAGKE